jgi:hypothetical protein
MRVRIILTGKDQDRVKGTVIMEEPVKVSAQASLVVIGFWFRRQGIWSVIEEQVKIKQKVRKYTANEKLMDCFLNILAGGHGLYETNFRIRPDCAVQQAFGRVACAEQSTISDTLNACQPHDVEAMRQAMRQILRQQGHSYCHAYEQEWQLLDVDMTGMPAGRQGEGVTKGYFAGEKNRRGRQLGRVLATWYDEIVVDLLYDGKRQLDRSLSELIAFAEEVLALDEQKRLRTILRIDGGGGDDENINWVLDRGYQILVKVKNWRRAHKLAATVRRWYPDPKVADREVGWVEEPFVYAQPTRQLALRKRKKDGAWSYHVLVFTLSDETLFHLCQQPYPIHPASAEILSSALHIYDRRGGGLETQIRTDKQGLGLTHRNKQRFAAQEMLVLLAQLAHNVIIWIRDSLLHVNPDLRHFGMVRMVRDLFHIPGLIRLKPDGAIQTIVLNQSHPYAHIFHQAFAHLLAIDDLSLILGKI